MKDNTYRMSDNGKTYRMLMKKEVIKDGDQYLVRGGEWVTIEEDDWMTDRMAVTANLVVRREVENG